MSDSPDPSGAPAGRIGVVTDSACDLAQELADRWIEHLAVLHADCPDVDEFVAQVRPHAPEEIVVGQIGPIGTHAGRGTIGIAFHEDL